ncbi:MAG: dihydroorotase, partial [Actinomycetota bacterium]|nr:dihydroorotase [Actinomycetota bacterium]
MSEELLIQGGRVLDADGERAHCDVRVVDGAVAEVGAGLTAAAGALVLDAEGCVVTPGLVDIQVHFREPGREDAETIETGSRAAAMGGCTAVVCMPNTDPPIDDAAVVQSIFDRARAVGLCDVRPAGCITKGREGVELAPLGELYDLGVRVFTDDGDCVADALVMRHAFEYAAALPGAVLAQHAEDPTLVRGGHMHEGAWSARLGIPGRPAEAESTIVARDLQLARRTGGRYHVLHMSCAASADLVRAAKAAGVRVTAECTPQHLVLTDESCSHFDPVFKMNPPLREQADVDALRAALLDGTIDAIATDHAPHPPESKEAPLDQAPPGMLGLETALALAITELDMPLAAVVAALSWKPAAIAGLGDRHGRAIEPGSPANITVFDPDHEWTVVPAKLASLSRNTPYSGRLVRGMVRHTIFGGVPVVVNGLAQREFAESRCAAATGSASGRAARREQAKRSGAQSLHSAQSREDLRAVVGHGDGVLGVGGEGAVGGDDGPVVVEHPHVVAAARDHHRLDREHDAGLEPLALAATAAVRHVG